MGNRRWLIPIVAVATALGGYFLRRGAFHDAVRSFRRCSMPTPGAYETVTARTVGRLYAHVAAEVGATCQTGAALDVGSGPGHLAVLLAREYPGLSVVGVDVLPSMVERAGRRAAEAGAAGRAQFLVGDVGALPFPDERFDVVVSRFSLHHWPEPARGLAEVGRVLRPGGEALIYDVPDWMRWIEQRGHSLARLAAESDFASVSVGVDYRLGPLPLLLRARLRRAGGDELGQSLGSVPSIWAVSPRGAGGHVR